VEPSPHSCRRASIAGEGRGARGQAAETSEGCQGADDAPRRSSAAGWAAGPCRAKYRSSDSSHASWRFLAQRGVERAARSGQQLVEISGVEAPRGAPLMSPSIVRPHDLLHSSLCGRITSNVVRPTYVLSMFNREGNGTALPRYTQTFGSTTHAVNLVLSPHGPPDGWSCCARSASTSRCRPPRSRRTSTSASTPQPATRRPERWLKLYGQLAVLPRVGRRIESTDVV